jgi:transposase
MSANHKGSTGEQGRGGLFGEEDVMSRAPKELHPGPPAPPRVMSAQRDQIELRAVDLDAMLAADHPARNVWAFVQALELEPLYAQIKSRDGGRGAPAIDPAILVALWLLATVEGVGSARELARLCERDDAYRWVCGGVGVNHHSLSDFRTGQQAWLDAQLTVSMVSLMDQGLVKLEVVAQDGMRVRASAKASSFRRQEKLAHLHALAQAQVQTLKRELDEDAGASSRRKQAARERVAKDREQRLAKALATMSKIKPPKQPKPSRRRGKKDDDSGPGGNGKAGTPAEPRVSTTDADARVMKMADGGFRPAYNVQLAVDAETQLIAAVEVVNSGSDMGQMAPMHSAVQKRYDITPSHWLADGGFTKLQAINELTERGTQPVVPPPKSRNPHIDCLQPKPDDTPAQAQWRELMGSEWGKELYLQRAATVECANAQLRRRGLAQFNVRGLIKVRAVALWHALAHNLMRMRSLNIAIAA